MKTFKQLISSVESDFPLRSSLFYKDSTGNPNGTWDYLSKDKQPHIDELINKQVEYNSNTMTFMTYNMVDPKVGVVNPFLGNPTAAQVMSGQWQVNEPEIERWK